MDVSTPFLLYKTSNNDIKGFALNDDRFKSGNTMTYFDELQEYVYIYKIDNTDNLYYLYINSNLCYNQP